MLEALESQIDAQLDRLANGEPVDWAALDQFTEVLTAKIGLHYAREAIARTNQEDATIQGSAPDEQRPEPG